MNQKSDQNITRRSALTKIGKLAKKLGLTGSLLLALKATAKADIDEAEQAEITRLLNDILHMKYLLKEFYSILNKNKHLIPPTYNSSFKAIRDHNHAHIIFIKTFISYYGDLNTTTPFLDAKFNTDNLNPAKNFDDFLQIAQILEDATASLYNKNLPELHESNIWYLPFLKLNSMHSVQARHAAYIRSIRAKRGVPLNPWISSATGNAVNSAMEHIYENEDNVKQLNIDVPSVTSVPVQAVKEAWDEPCDNKPINRLFRIFNVNYF